MRLAHATPTAAIRRQRAVHGAGTIGRLEALVSHDDESAARGRVLVSDKHATDARPTNTHTSINLFLRLRWIVLE